MQGNLEPLCPHATSISLQDSVRINFFGIFHQSSDLFPSPRVGLKGLRGRDGRSNENCCDGCRSRRLPDSHGRGIDSLEGFQSVHSHHRHRGDGGRGGAIRLFTCIASFNLIFLKKFQKPNAASFTTHIFTLYSIKFRNEKSFSFSAINKRI